MHLKKLILLLLALHLAIMVNAQLPFNFGPKIGFTSSKLNVDNSAIVEEFKSNPQGGVFFRFGGKTYFQPEVNFLAKGGLFSEDTVTRVKEIDLASIEVPLLIGREIIGFKAMNLRWMFGPTMTFIVDKNIRMQQGVEISDKEKLNDALKDVIWGLQAGLGVDLFMFTFDVRYEWGLNNLLNDSDSKMKSAAFNISVGLKLL